MNVCITLLTGLGDVVHGLPIVNAIKRAQPTAHITWVTEPMPSGMLRPHPAVDEVIVFHKQQGIRGVRQLRREMKRRRFDVALNFNIYFKSVWPLLFARAPRRIGFGRERSRDGVWLFTNQHLPPGPRAHTQDMFLEFLALLGVAREPLQWLIPITVSERLEQEAFFDPLRDRPIVGVVGASANHNKDWPVERYPALIDALVERFNAHVVLLGGPGAREQAIARATVEATRNRPVWGLGDSIRRLVWLIDGCSLIIAPDTGPVHIARALGVPVIGLYGHTNPWRVGPYRKYQELWIDKYTEPGAAPDPSSFDPKGGRMALISVAEILEKVACVL
ncbi:MAG: glycosyltransferase family 9 protein, partial [Gemmatimonadota bacterium]